MFKWASVTDTHTRDSSTSVLHLELQWSRRVSPPVPVRPLSRRSGLCDYSTVTLEVELPECGALRAASLVSAQHQLGQSDERVSFGRRPQTADLTDGLLTVVLSEVVGLFHTVTLRSRTQVDEWVRRFTNHRHFCSASGTLSWMNPKKLDWFRFFQLGVTLKYKTTG